MEANAAQKRGVKYQYLTAFVANLTTIAFGVFEGWNNPNILLLTSNDTPLPTGPVSMEEISWVVSLQFVGCLFGNILFGYIINNFGRKIPLIICTIPMILSWLLILFAQSVYYLYVARLLGGFFGGGGGYMIVPLFLSEIANDHVRGNIVSTLVLSENIGILMAFTIGTFCKFYVMPIYGIILYAVFGIVMCYFPETPMFLVKQNKIEAAEKSLRFYQNIQNTDNDRKLLASEIDQLKRTVQDNQTISDDDNALKWSDFTTQIARRAIIIGVALVAMNQYTGIVAILTYSTNIFKEAGSNLSPNESTFVVGIIQVIGTYAANLFVDRSGRRLLLTISNIGSALGLVLLSTYMMLKSWGVDLQAFNWIPIAAFSFIICVGSLGVLSLPLVVISEIMPEKIKDAAVSFCMSLLWIFAFTAVKYLPFLTELLGFHGSMFLFAGICVLAAAFIILFVPETKGKSHEEIMNSLR